METTAFQCPAMSHAEKTLKVFSAGEGAGKAGQVCQTRFNLAQETLRVCEVIVRSMVSGRMPR
jgi:hypothetical protein